MLSGRQERNKDGIFESELNFENLNNGKRNIELSKMMKEERQ